MGSRRVSARAGSEFRITLPCLSESCGGAVSIPSLAAIRGGAVDVLIVEDNADVAEGLMMLLELLGQRVRTAPDGVSALAAARASRPDIMLVDIGLPGMNGYELARIAREDPQLKQVMLVALTGYGRDGDRQRALEAGFDDHVVKPMSAEAFQRLQARLAK